jgi:monoamine oxidase
MRRSFHSPLTGMLREAHAAGDEAAATGLPIDEVIAIRAERFAAARARQADIGLDRRGFLKQASAAGIGLAALLPRAGIGLAASPPRVVIVGAGLAGLRCAHKLWIERGMWTQIFEGDNRVGGRVETLRGYFANGQITEQHGEFISSEHRSTLALAKRFGLKLDNANISLGNTNDTAWFNGARYTQAQVSADWHRFGWKLFYDAVMKAPNASYLGASAAAREWDQMSVTDWIEANIPGGLASDFGRLCYADVISEYGGPPEEQSALNLIYVLGYDTSTGSSFQPRGMPVLGGTDEKWHIRGGNDQIITGMVQELPSGTINTGYRLVALQENADGSYTCSFETGPATVDVAADHVVLAIPFTTLRQVDLSKVTLSPLKQTAIQNLQLGNNAKIQIQVAGRPWVKDGFSGSLLTDDGADGGWDATSYQPGTSGPGATEIYMNYLGGSDGQALAAKYGLIFGQDEGPAPPAMVNDALAELEPIFPGITAAWNAGPRLAWVNDGNIDPQLLGAYSQYNVGQYTGFGGIEGVREGNIHFAGEHTSPAFQGFMEGAVESGERVADEI